MQEDETSRELGPADHALLFAWIAKAVSQRAGEQRGEVVMRKAVRRYGEERGRRMALRAQADGQPLTMANFLAYGELTFPEDAGEFEELARGPDLIERVYRCLWHRAWVENDLLPYGRFYCLEVDRALVYGFNPALRLDVNGTLPNGAGHCEFVFHGARVEPDAAGEPGHVRGAAMPWEYHLGHLFKTVGDVAVEELGAMGRDAMVEALAEFARRYGKEAAHRVEDYRDVDFRRP